MTNAAKYFHTSERCDQSVWVKYVEQHQIKSNLTSLRSQIFDILFLRPPLPLQRNLRYLYRVQQSDPISKCPDIMETGAGASDKDSSRCYMSKACSGWSGTLSWELRSEREGAQGRSAQGSTQKSVCLGALGLGGLQGYSSSSETARPS